MFFKDWIRSTNFLCSSSPKGEKSHLATHPQRGKIEGSEMPDNLLIFSSSLGGKQFKQV